MSEQLNLLAVVKQSVIAVIASAGVDGLTPEQQQLIKNQLSKSDLALLWGAGEIVASLSTKIGTPLELLIAPGQGLVTFLPGKYQNAKNPDPK